LLVKIPADLVDSVGKVFISGGKIRKTASIPV
jgi:hypothetical protein